MPPTIAPPMPSAIVAYHGIGSGPGSAQRASTPMMKPPTISPMIHTRRTLCEGGRIRILVGDENGDEEGPWEADA